VIKLVTGGIKITDSTNPTVLTKNVTLTVLECCTTPPVRLTAHCRGAGAGMLASVASPNPVTIRPVIYFVSEIYEKC